MDRIRKLDQSQASLITASYSIYSLSSVVRELAENSIDANADEIYIQLVDDGLSKISVFDNGIGISELENVAVNASSSSKEKNAQCTYGYKGSFLKTCVSICASLTIDSNSGGIPSSVQIKSDFSKTELKSSRIRGTCITLEGLFSNLPVRQKEWSANRKSELAKVRKELMELAMTNRTAKIRVSLVVENEETDILSIPKNRSVIDTVAMKYGSKFVKTHKSLQDICIRHSSDSELLLDAYLFTNTPSLAQKDSICLYWLRKRVNCPELSRNITKGLTSERNMGLGATLLLIFVKSIFPAFILEIVNVKYDIGLSASKDLLIIDNADVLSGKIIEALLNCVTESKPKLVQTNIPEARDIDLTHKKDREIGSTLKCDPISSDSIDRPTVIEAEIERRDFENLEIIGQFNKGFIVCSLKRLPGKLVIIDQHAADERINLEAFQWNRVIRPQTLVSPLKVPDRLFFEESRVNRLLELGFLVSSKDGSFYLNSIPSDLAQLDFEMSDFIEVYENILYLESNPSSYPKKLFEHLASKACRSSIMIGDDLSVSQMAKIINGLSAARHPWVLRSFYYIDMCAWTPFVSSHSALLMMLKKAMLAQNSPLH